MKNLNSISDQELLSQIRSLSGEERRIGLEILYRLREIEERKLFATLGYGSLHEFAVTELHYSDGAAHRRIQSMRLLKDLPAAEERLKCGALSLTNASQLQDFFRAEKKLGKAYDSREKSILLNEMSGKSARQAQALLLARSPEAIPEEKLTPVDETHLKLTVVLSPELSEKLSRLKGLLAHRLPNASYAELLNAVADLALQKLDPQVKPGGNRAKSSNTKNGEAAATAAGTGTGTGTGTAPAPELVQRQAPGTQNPALGTPKQAPSRYVSAPVRRLVFRRAQGRCEYHFNGRRCSSRYALEVDHIVPVGKQGPSTLENLQLLCRTHNAHKNLGDYGFLYGVPHAPLDLARQSHWPATPLGPPLPLTPHSQCSELRPRPRHRSTKSFHECGCKGLNPLS